MNKSVHLVGKVAWVLTALAAINVGLHQFGHDFYMMPFMVSHPQLEMALRYLMLAAGVVSLAMLVMHCSSKGGMCE